MRFHLVAMPFVTCASLLADAHQSIAKEQHDQKQSQSMSGYPDQTVIDSTNVHQAQTAILATNPQHTRSAILDVNVDIAESTGYNKDKFSTYSTEQDPKPSQAKSISSDADTNATAHPTLIPDSKPSAPITAYDKRSNPVYFNLVCSGDDTAQKVRTCNKTDLNGDWCQRNCWCTWTGCMKCKGLRGCSDAVVLGTCTAQTSKWDCNCVGFGPKDGKTETCIVI